MSSSTSVDIASLQLPRGVQVHSHREGLRVQCAGWHVDVCGSVVVPPRYTAVPGMDMTGLFACLTVANRLAAKGLGSSTPTEPTRRPTPRGRVMPADDPNEDLSIDAAVDKILMQTADVVETRWHIYDFDLYQCLRSAWNSAEQAVPWTSLTARIRAIVDDGDILRYNDGLLALESLTAARAKAAALVRGAAHSTHVSTAA
ncbi:Uncharacterised protein [Mycolicibacterium fortuitum]|uniref:Uncharacterized protein n=1 Tax=Mycolicibacterium fortuitum TaxID=1766 RepID=A0A378WEN1_MYCFO|nr:Uncharacterised protein [Mycolicibacterium fortuitum]